MKPIVQYRTFSEPTMMIQWDVNDCAFWCARLEVVDHPLLGTGNIRTSEIVTFNPVGGIIETKNTIYVPEI